MPQQMRPHHARTHREGVDVRFQGRAQGVFPACLRRQADGQRVAGHRTACAFSEPGTDSAPCGGGAASSSWTMASAHSAARGTESTTARRDFVSASYITKTSLSARRIAPARGPPKTGNAEALGKVLVRMPVLEVGTRPGAAMSHDMARAALPRRDIEASLLIATVARRIGGAATMVRRARRVASAGRQSRAASSAISIRLRSGSRT